MKLSSVVNRINGNVDRFTTDLKYYIGGEHFESNELAITKKGLLKENLNILGFKFHFAFQERDVIFMARNPHLRKAGMVMFSGLCSDASYILRSKDENVLTQEFLAVQLQSDHFWDYCESHKVGSVNFANNWSSIANYEFDLPPIEVQRKIGEKVWAAYRVKESYKKLLAATDDMLKAKFIEMFVGKTQTVPLYDVADITTGSTPSRFNTEYWGGNNLWVSAQDMWSKYIWDTIEKVSESGYAKCKKIPAGSILYVCRGSIGLMAINKRECATNQSICTATCNEKCLSEYLYYYLEYSKEKTQKTGVGTSFKALNQSTFASIKIELPPLPLQQEFVAIATQAEATKESLRKSIENIDQVIKSLINQ